nr:hypothetical protein [Pedobacter sp. ASV19]
MFKFKFLLFALSVFYCNRSVAQTNPMAEIMLHYQTDRTLLRNFYTVETSPESRIRFKALAEDYLKKIN